jgi:membrane protease YdiL (CAAX protease family)
MTGRSARRRAALTAVPVLVPLSMAATFAVLQRLLGPRRAYRAGFALYWGAWCGAFPLWVLGPRGAARLLLHARRPGLVDLLLLAAPAVGAVTTELLPRRRGITPRVAAVMVGTALVNAVGEELLWRGVFLRWFPTEQGRGAVWPLLGFTAWHLAPQLVLPSSRGRLPFLAGAALVGAVATLVSRRTRGLLVPVVAHVVTDACGVRAARFRLGLDA